VSAKQPPPVRTTTPSGIPVDTVYRDASASSPLPGDFPFTRGVHRDMYRGRLWTMRQYAGFGSPEATNERYHFLLDQGQTGLSVAFDLPSQIGYDSDDPDAEDEVGRVGVPIDTLADMEVVFDGIPLDRISTSFTINGTAAIMLAMYLAVAERQGVSYRDVTGTLQNDILKEFVARGTWIFPVDPSLRLVTDTIEYCMHEVPRFNPISIAGAHFRDAGANAAQEMAFTLADGLAYVDRCVARGLDPNVFGRRLSFFFYTHTDIFEEVAKNNIVRIAYEALASVLGGVQSIFTCAWDEALTLPSQETAELALRTQQVLAYETGVPAVADPLGGSHYVEALTDAYADRIRQIIAEVEERGGMVPCIESGWVQQEISATAYDAEKTLRSGERPVVGVNLYRRDAPPPDIELYETSETEIARQQQRLAATKASRDDTAVSKNLEALAAAAAGEENLMPYLIDCVKAYCTVGEMTRSLTGVFGTFQQPKVF
jgi:methylmalonyl-CoA mutase N-terminal domain/subunit